MDFLRTIVDFALHFDRHLELFVQQYGFLTYAILFVIIFCETGLVVTPFLPGDSLLFAAGALAASLNTGGVLNIFLLFVVLAAAAVLGDTVNYLIGAYIGPKVFDRNSRFFKKEYLDRTNEFYEKYGGKTIILARFVPIVRTFAPFVAGVGKMNYSRFIAFNVVGGVAWVAIFLFLGYLFGNIPFVKNNFEIVTLGIVLISILPMVFEYVRSRRQPQPAPVSDAPVQGEIDGAA
ncbi:MAG TPA: DedA family protein [Roseiflexaceae bacterium]